MNDVWQPIETAPKDGTNIFVLLDDGRMTTVYWTQYTIGDNYWSLVVWGSYAEETDVNPTRWLPLPKLFTP